MVDEFASRTLLQITEVGSAVWRVLVVLKPSYSIPGCCARLLTPGTSGMFTTVIKLILEDSLSD